LNSSSALRISVSCSASTQSYELIKQIWIAVEELGVNLSNHNSLVVKAAEQHFFVDASLDINKRSSSHLIDLQYDAIMHRLTRHSISTILDMQHFAEHFVDVLSDILTTPMTITIRNWEWADRPSLRVIARIVTLIHARKVPIFWEYLSVANDASKKQSPWRKDFLLNFCNYTGVPNSPTIFPGAQIHSELSLIQRALVDMSWDNILPEYAVANASLPLTVSLHYAIAFLNVGATQEGYQMITQIESSQAYQDPILYAYIAYIKGLIEAKRFKQPSQGLESFHKGLECLSHSEGDEAILSWGWLKNGQALAYTMSALESAERDKLLMKIFDEEAIVYNKLIATPHKYLRYNVLANMAFLLELMGRYREAIRFWEGAFNREKMEAINYRIGILQMKVGENEGAYHSLEKALSSYERDGNEFHELEAIYALAFVGDILGHPVDHWLDRGTHLSNELGDATFRRLFKQWQSSGKRSEHKPNGKQISYVPYAELDCEFRQNFNQYLEVTAHNA